ncbi:Hypothetical protein NTJ_03616 [Nesidiocoris tenuis]|uniref:Uncharacterized protein n=1 Tax=Nesidiocoris tenuis TaxID=355587 RepID=A0ABN7AEV2_9HEMI|nr:Hypothetical protein NTJ_03616 [Nesidiocoris tenuis]
MTVGGRGSQNHSSTSTTLKPPAPRVTSKWPANRPTTAEPKEEKGRRNDEGLRSFRDTQHAAQQHRATLRPS